MTKKNIGDNFANLEASMKVFLLSKPERRPIFDRYYERLKATANTELDISPDEALVLLAHHLFMFPLASELMALKNTNHPLTDLLNQTLDELRKNNDC
jgi:predicted helicase